MSSVSNMTSIWQPVDDASALRSITAASWVVPRVQGCAAWHCSSPFHRRTVAQATLLQDAEGRQVAGLRAGSQL